MVKKILLKRGTTTATAAYTGKVREVTIDTDKKVLVVHDGETAGGTALAKLSALPTSLSKLTEDSIICQNNFRHSFSLTWSGKTCDIRRSL